MAFFDMHTHILCGIDDGARDREEMCAMVRMAYEDGTRAICLTPHYSPYLFGDTSESSERAFRDLQAFVAAEYPDLELFLGHELGYHDTCTVPLNDGRCRTLGGTRYLLVDFPSEVGFTQLREALVKLLSLGYRPVLAHAERYRGLSHRLKWVRDFIDDGGLIQINAASATGDYGSFAQKQWGKLIKEGLVHVISSDAHDTSSRPPLMSVCLPALEKYADAEEIAALTWGNAWKILHNEHL